ncbi:MAG: hypothetical protein V1726_06880 [Methanobacteriota archaeon]
MELIPFISIRKKKLWAEQEERLLTLQEIKKRVETDKKIYVVDYDGKEKNAPNLELLQELAEHYVLWADTGPRSIDDVVDVVISGASMITIRSTLWPDIDLPALKEVTEDELYATIDLLHTTPRDLNTSVFYGVDGILVLNTKQQLDKNSTLGSYLKDLIATHKLYTFESQPENVIYWQNKGISGIIADISTIQEISIL